MDTLYIKCESAFQELWKKYRLLLILLVAALWFDAVSTINFMQTDGIYLEIHPLTRACATWLGPVSGPLLYTFLFRAVGGVLMALYLRRFSAWVLIAPIITSTLAGFINFFGQGVCF